MNNCTKPNNLPTAGWREAVSHKQQQMHFFFFLRCFYHRRQFTAKIKSVASQQSFIALVVFGCRWYLLPLWWPIKRKSPVYHNQSQDKGNSFFSCCSQKWKLGLTRCQSAADDEFLIRSLIIWTATTGQLKSKGFTAKSRWSACRFPSMHVEPASESASVPARACVHVCFLRY